MADETILNNQLNNETILNSQVASGNETMYNPQATNGSETMYNPQASNDASSTMYNGTAASMVQPGTVLNSAALQAEGFISGQLIDGYKIIDKLKVKTGEADLYLAEAGGKQYVLKLYRRDTAVKPDILEELKKMDSPYIAKLVATGNYNGRPFEVLPYYAKGSLQGHTFSFEELKNTIIPQLNEALRELHSRDIVHKDLKPSNIMLQDNGMDIAIIDFGISSMKEEGNTIILTKTGFTPDYTAHEAFNGLFLNESDYYSMGVTLLELYTGSTPYENMTADQIELYTSAQKLPLPDEMEQELKELIAALTYYDITNRKDKTNPNRRWTYEEVKKWLDGEKQIIPGSGAGFASEEQEENAGETIEKYIFMGTEYRDRHKLAIAFAKNWDEAKKELFNGMLSARFKGTDQEFAIACMDAEEAYGTGINSDLLFFRILYKLDKSLEDFIWRGHQYNTLEALGKDVQDRLWKYNKPDMVLINEILRYRIISEYLLTIENVPEELKTAVAAIETGYIQYSKDVRQRRMNYFLLGYLLSGRKIFYKEEHEFASVDELVRYLQELLQNSYQKFEDYCATLLGEDGKLDVQLETWLMSLGKGELIDQWKKQLSL